jgi:hypothetical protein
VTLVDKNSCKISIFLFVYKVVFLTSFSERVVHKILSLSLFLSLYGNGKNINSVMDGSLLWVSEDGQCSVEVATK